MNMENAKSMSPVRFRAAVDVVFLEGNRQNGSNTDRGTLAALAELKKMRTGGGFETVSPLTHMNRHKQQTRRTKPKAKQKPNLRKKEPCKPNNQ